MRADTVISIAKKEIMDNIRNKWIILVSIMFAVLTLVVSYFGSITSHGWQNLGNTIGGMTSFATYLISIIGFMLGYATIIGEIERGSMSALLSLAATRFEIVVGKFLGLGSVLCFTVLVGFGTAGIVIGVNVSNVDYLQDPGVHRDDHGLRPCVLERGVVFLHGVFQTINCAWRNDFSVVSLHDHPANCVYWAACDDH